jgi:hypothetical protein
MMTDRHDFYRFCVVTVRMSPKKGGDEKVHQIRIWCRASLLKETIKESVDQLNAYYGTGYETTEVVAEIAK